MLFKRLLAKLLSASLSFFCTQLSLQTFFDYLEGESGDRDFFEDFQTDGKFQFVTLKAGKES